MAGGGWLGGLVELLLLRLEVGGGLGAHLFGCKKWFVRSVILDQTQGGGAGGGGGVGGVRGCATVDGHLVSLTQLGDS